MGGPQDRRAPRIPHELTVHIVGPKGSTPYLTHDVSRGGIFIKTDSPKSMRQLLRIQLDLADRKPPLEVHGMVVHAVNTQEADERGEPPGMGIEFIAFGGEPRQRWEDHLRQVHVQGKSSPLPGTSGPLAEPAAQTSAQSPAPPHPAAAPAQIARRPDLNVPAITPSFPQTPGHVAPDVKITHKKPKKRKIVRHVFPIPVQDVEQLYEIYERDFTSGMMFLYTTEKIPIGERVSARVIHPINLEEFDIHAKVKLVHEDPGYPGLTLAIRPSTLARREKFRAFIEAGLPVEDLAVDVLDDD